MYADIAGSTALYEALGNVKAQRLVNDCLVLLKGIAEEHRGTVLLELGDEIMCCFDDAGDAAAAACSMHAAASERSFLGSSVQPLRIRIGAHCGVFEDGGEFLSDTARVAHWATGNAKPEQTLATDAFVAALPRIYKAVSRYVDDETWQFVSIEHMALHEIIWDVESVTACRADQPKGRRRGCSQVMFTFGDKSMIIDESKPVISVGRERANDLVVDHELVSRQHFSAQFSRGRCTITDNSTNGTLLIGEGQTKHELKRDTLPLTGSGLIVMGRPVEIDENFAIHYECS